MTNEDRNQALRADEKRSSLPAAPEYGFDPEALKLKLQYFGATAVPSALALEIMGAGLGGIGLALVGGGAAAYFAEEIHDVIEPGLRLAGHLLALLSSGNGTGRASSRLLNRDWWLGQETPVQYADQGEEEDESEDDLRAGMAGSDELEEAEDDLFAQPHASDTGGIARLTLEQIIAKTEPNSYTAWVGRSLTKPGNPAIQIRFYKQHLRFIGASQYGKSSMAAAFLWTITRTHDPKRLRIAILDKEDQTGNLFEGLPHLFRMRVGGQVVTLHARNDKQVLQYLMCVVEIMRQRYEMSKQEMLAQPVLLVYIEEFLSLKNFFKAEMDSAKGEAKAQAAADYASLVYSIEELSQRGLKVRVQLLLCAQVEYADDDFKEAMVNVSCGMSFCVRPRAAAAAGFRSTELLNRNYKENKVGQAVIETPHCTDLVLAPEFDLEQRLIALESEEEAHTRVLPETAIPSVDVRADVPQSEGLAVAPVIQEKNPRAEDFDIAVLVACWNGGANSVTKLQVLFKTSHHEAYKMYQLIKAQKHEPVEEQE